MTKAEYIVNMEHMLKNFAELNKEAMKQGIIKPGDVVNGTGRIANVHLTLSFQGKDDDNIELVCAGFYAGTNVKSDYTVRNEMIEDVYGE